MIEATHRVLRDVFDPKTGEKRLSPGDHVKAVNLGDHVIVWLVPSDPLAKPVTLQPWMVSSSLAAIDSRAVSRR